MMVYALVSFVLCVIGLFLMVLGFIVGYFHTDEIFCFKAFVAREIAGLVLLVPGSLLGLWVSENDR